MDAQPAERTAPPVDGLPSAGVPVPPERSGSTAGWVPWAWPPSCAPCCGSRTSARLWLSMSFSSFGDWLGLLATTAMASSPADGYAAANFALGGVLLFRLLPALVLGPLAGAFADRFDRRKTMVVADVLRFALFASIPLVDNLMWLFVAQFLIEASACSGSRRRRPRSPTCFARTSWSRPTSSPSHDVRDHAGARRDRVRRVDHLGDRFDFFPGVSGSTSRSTSTRCRSWSPRWCSGICRRSPAAAHGRGASRESFPGSLRQGLSFVGTTPMVRGLVLGILGAMAAAGVMIATAQLFASALVVVRRPSDSCSAGCSSGWGSVSPWVRASRATCPVSGSAGCRSRRWDHGPAHVVAFVDGAAAGRPQGFSPASPSCPV